MEFQPVKFFDRDDNAASSFVRFILFFKCFKFCKTFSFIPLVFPKRWQTLILHDMLKCNMYFHSLEIIRIQQDVYSMTQLKHFLLINFFIFNASG